MIKTLRITSVLAAIAAVVLIKYFVFPMMVGAGGDERIDKVLDSPTVVDKFREAKGSHTRSTGTETPPLVQQAVAFARIINPEPKVERRTAGGTNLPPKADIRATSPKFKVFATTYFEGNPSLSQALIDEPGRERRWVRQSSMVGHLLIEQVKDGVVVVKSSNDTYELAVETNPQAAPAKRSSPVSGAITGQSVQASASPAAYGRTAAGIQRTPSRPPLTRTGPDQAKREQAADELIKRLRDLQRSRTGEESDRIDDLISKFKSTQVSTEDAKNLTKLGEKVQSEGKDPNHASSMIKGGKIDVGAAETDPDEQK